MLLGWGLETQPAAHVRASRVGPGAVAAFPSLPVGAPAHLFLGHRQTGSQMAGTLEVHE
jgi:hypothetical protein